ncbi:MAG TPA: hypothetical protein VGJ60_34540 [Chloroflexota bacterium]|jgi:hypothetical protein
MDSLIANYSSLMTSAVAAVQKLGLATVPLVIAIAAIVNYFGGEKAIRAVGMAIAVVAVLSLILVNATALSTWITSVGSSTH